MLRRHLGGGTVRPGAAAAGAPGPVPAAGGADRSRRADRQRRGTRRTGAGAACELAGRLRCNWCSRCPCAPRTWSCCRVRCWQDCAALPQRTGASLAASSRCTAPALTEAIDDPRGDPWDIAGYRARGHARGDAAEPVPVPRVRGAAPGKRCRRRPPSRGSPADQRGRAAARGPADPVGAAEGFATRLPDWRRRRSHERIARERGAGGARRCWRLQDRSAPPRAPRGRGAVRPVRAAAGGARARVPPRRAAHPPTVCSWS